MRILVVGGGGREHALVWKLGRSPAVRKIYCAPGNAGIAGLAECVPLDTTDLEGLADLARREHIDLTVVGPEAPLAAGIVDVFTAAGLPVFGPNRRAARLEGSKAFAKQLMQRCGIPTAPFAVFDDQRQAMDYLAQAQYPLVVKADGLAAGKGVTVAAGFEEAAAAVARMMGDRIFGAAGDRLIIEECLEGEEASLLALTDGQRYLLLPGAQDHKRAFDGDRGPNTGGMGAYSPTPLLTDNLVREAEEKIIRPLLRGLRDEGIDYRGVLYCGMMLTRQGPQVLEFNVRFGDPETQVILPRLESDLLPLLQGAAAGDLPGSAPRWTSRACACVVIAAEGYPGPYRRGEGISGLEAFAGSDNPLIFHAGTSSVGGRYLTAGGRVLGVTALGDDLAGALAVAYGACERIAFRGAYYRRDIGWRALSGY